MGLGEALLMSTHNICFRREIRKLFTLYPLLSRPMLISLLSFEQLGQALHLYVLYQFLVKQNEIYLPSLNLHCPGQQCNEFCQTLLCILFRKACWERSDYLFVLRFYGPVNPMGHVQHGQFVCLC